MSRQKATLDYRVQDNQAVLCAVIDGVDTVMLTLDEHPTNAGIYLEGDKVIYAQKKWPAQHPQLVLPGAPTLSLPKKLKQPAAQLGE